MKKGIYVIQMSDQWFIIFYKVVKVLFSCSCTVSYSLLIFGNIGSLIMQTNTTEIALYSLDLNINQLLINHTVYLLFQNTLLSVVKKDFTFLKKKKKKHQRKKDVH